MRAVCAPNDVCCYAGVICIFRINGINCLQIFSQSLVSIWQTVKLMLTLIFSVNTTKTQNNLGSWRTGYEWLAKKTLDLKLQKI